MAVLLKSTPLSPSPAGGMWDASWSKNDDYLAVATTSSPYFYVYARDGSTFTALSTASITMPTAYVQCVAFDEGNNYVVIGFNASPWIRVYRVNNGALEDVSATLGSTLTARPRSLAFAPDGIHFVVSGDNTTYKHIIYEISGGVVSKTMDLSTSYLGSYYSDTMDWVVGDGNYTYIITGNGLGNFLHIAKVDSYTTVSSVSVDPTSENMGGHGLNSSLDGLKTACVFNADYGAGINLVVRSTGDTFTVYNSPAAEPPTSYGYGVSWNADNSVLCVADYSYDNLLFYSISGNTLTRISSYIDTNQAYPNSVVFNRNPDRDAALFVGQSEASPSYALYLAPDLTGHLTLTGYEPDAAISDTVISIGGSGALALTSSAPTIVQTTAANLIPSVGDLILTPNLALVAIRIDIAVGTLEFNVPAVWDGGSSVWDSGASLWDVSAPTIDQTTVLYRFPASSDLTLAGYEPSSALSGEYVPVPSTALTLSSSAPTLVQTTSANLSVPAATLTFSTDAPVFIVAFLRSVPDTALTLSSSAPTLVQTTSANLSVPAALLTLTTTAPESVEDFLIEITDAGTLTFTGYAPVPTHGPHFIPDATVLFLDAINNAPALKFDYSIVVPSTSLEIILADDLVDEVVLGINANGEDQSVTILDSTAYEQEVTAYGDAKLTTTYKKFGSASVAINHENSRSRIEVTAHESLRLEDKDFTFELWFRLNSAVTNGHEPQLISCDTGYETNNQIDVYCYDGGISAWFYAGDIQEQLWVDVEGTNPSVGVWHFLAISKNGDTLSVYLDGALLGTDTNAAFEYSSAFDGLYCFGQWLGYVGAYTDYTLDGQLDDIRFTIGTGRYPSTCTVPEFEFEFIPSYKPTVLELHYARAEFDFSYSIPLTVEYTFTLPEQTYRAFDFSYSLAVVQATEFEFGYDLRTWNDMAQEVEFDAALVTDKEFEFGYSLAVEPMQEFEFGYELYANELVGKEFEFDAALVIDIEFEFKYSTATTTDREFSFVYSTTGSVAKETTYIYELLEKNPAISVKDFIYSLSGGQVILTDDQPHVIFNSETIPIVTAEVAASEDDLYWTASIQLADLEDYIRFKQDDEFIVDIFGEQYTFVVDSKAIGRTAPGINQDVQAPQYTLEGVSPSARFDSPRALYPELFTQTWNIPVMASQAALEALQSLDPLVTLPWSLVDWLLPAFRLAVERVPPIEVVTQLATAVGGVVQSDRAGDLYVRHLYPVSTTDYETAAVDHTFNEIDDIINVSGQTVAEEIVNKLRILDIEAGYKDSLDWTENENDPLRLSGTLYAYPSPWRDPSGVNVRHTVCDGRINMNYLGVVTQQMPDPEGDEEYEVVEIVAGQGSTSKPIWSIIDVLWYSCTLGSVTFESGGTTLSVSGSSLDLNQQYGLIGIKYNTKFYKYNVVSSQYKPAQFVMEDLTV